MAVLVSVVLEFVALFVLGRMLVLSQENKLTMETVFFSSLAAACFKVSKDCIVNTACIQNELGKFMGSKADPSPKKDKD